MSCDLLSDSEVEITEVDRNVVDIAVSPNFVEYKSNERPVHIKVLD